jgi:hypothetical protein
MVAEDMRKLERRVRWYWILRLVLVSGGVWGKLNITTSWGLRVGVTRLRLVASTLNRGVAWWDVRVFMEAVEVG